MNRIADPDNPRRPSLSKVMFNNVLQTHWEHGHTCPLCIRAGVGDECGLSRYTSTASSDREYVFAALQWVQDSGLDDRDKERLFSLITEQAKQWDFIDVPRNIEQAMEEDTTPQLELEQHYKRFGTGLKLSAGLFVAGAVLVAASYGIKDYVIPFVVEHARWILLAITALLSLVVLVYVIGWMRVEAYPRVANRMGWSGDDDE